MGSKKSITTQPDYQKWQEVQIGMNYDQVTALLGEPEVIIGNSRTKGEFYYLFFGCLHLRSIPSPSPYRFVVGFNKDELVWMKSDPFDGVFSTDGRPSKPIIISPLELSEFNHYPRVVDLRWGPASGVYPIKYDLEISTESVERENCFFVLHNAHGIDATHFIWSHSGMGNARFRVREVNETGIGEWSDYRNMIFLR